jgi:hypothetical protein
VEHSEDGHKSAFVDSGQSMNDKVDLMHTKFRLVPDLLERKSETARSPIRRRQVRWVGYSHLYTVRS